MKLNFCCLLLILNFLMYSPVLQAQEAHGRALMAKGDLIDIRDNVKKFMKLYFFNGQLHVNRQIWSGEKLANTRTWRIDGKGVNSIDYDKHFMDSFGEVIPLMFADNTAIKIESDDKKIVNTIVRGKIKGVLVFKQDVLKHDSVSIKLEEVYKLKRKFSLDINGDNFTLTFHAPDEKIIVTSQNDFSVLHQTKDKKEVSYKAANFAMFYMKHITFCDDIFFPLLKHYGIDLPVLPNDVDVQQAVLAGLVNVKDGSSNFKEVYKQLLMQLNHDEYDKREKAYSALSMNYKKYAKFIEETMQDKTVSLEVKTTLNEIKNNQKQGQASLDNKYIDVINHLQLMKNKTYLFGLLEKANMSEKKLIIRQLKKITGQDHGEDIAKWQEAIKP